MSAYDALAPSFDRQRALPGGVAAAIRRAVLDALCLPRPRLLDLGCGAGRIGAAFVAADDDYVGVDLSLGMLRVFAARDDLPDGVIRPLAQADGERLPFPDATFDAVLLMQVLSAAGGWRRLLAEAGRLLRPSGTLIVGRTVAPEDGVDARMKQRLAEILDAMGEHPYRKQATTDALAMLTRTAPASRSVNVATWCAERTPRRFLERHGAGARFSRLPAAVQDAAMQRVRDWAIATFGSLDAAVSEPFRYELNLFNLQPGKPH